MNNIENALIAVAIAEALLNNYTPPVDTDALSDEEYKEYMQTEQFEF